MPPPRTGSVEPGRRADGTIYFRARVRLADGSRVRVDVPEKHAKPAGGKTAQERAELYALAAQEREDEDGALLARKKAGTLGRRPRVQPTADMSKWLDAWIGAREANGQTSTRENRSHYETHIAPAIGGKHVRDWTAVEMRTLSRYLDEQIQGGHIAWKTARNVWTTAGKMLADAVRSKRDEIRCRDTNPIRDVEGPNRGADRAHPYLYPSELLDFVEHPDVPLMWRRAVALAVYTYARAAELRALRWADVDLKHGTIHVHRARARDTGEDKPTKTKHARRFALEPSILPLLRTMHAEAKEEGHAGADDYIVELTSERDLSRGLKRWLTKAKITRPELHATDATRQAMRFHDLRATGITWMAVRKDAPQAIQSRAGHTDYTTTLGYIREAETLAASFGEVFPALPELATDWAKDRAKSRKLVPKYANSKRGGRDSNPRTKSSNRRGFGFGSDLAAQGNCHGRKPSRGDFRESLGRYAGRRNRSGGRQRPRTSDRRRGHGGRPRRSARARRSTRRAAPGASRERRGPGGATAEVGDRLTLRRSLECGWRRGAWQQCHEEPSQFAARGLENVAERVPPRVEPNRDVGVRRLGR